MVERSITIVMPALNEEVGLAPSVQMARDLLAEKDLDYEILVVNDGSSDQTGVIADRLASESAQVRVLHHDSPMGLGFSYMDGVRNARKGHVMLMTANQECDFESIARIIDCMGQADIIIPYVENTHERPFLRRIVSRAYVFLLNAITGIGIRYYNGTVLHRTQLIASLAIATDSYGYQAEALTRLIRAGHSYREVAIRVNYRPHNTKAFKLKNILGVLRSLKKIFSMVYTLRVKGGHYASQF